MVEKKTARTVLDQKCFFHIFIKFYWNKCVLVNTFNMCMETFYQNKVFLFKFFINFNWNQCVSVNILICTCTNCIKPLCFGRKKNSKNCAWSKVFLSHFYNSSTKTNGVSVSILICARINSTKTLCFGRKIIKNCAWSKVFLSHFYKVLLKQMCIILYFNLHMENFYWNKVFQ